MFRRSATIFAITFGLSFSAMAQPQFSKFPVRDLGLKFDLIGLLIFGNTVSPADLGNDYTVNVEVGSGNKVDIDLDMSSFFDPMANDFVPNTERRKGMQVFARSMDDVRPTCAEIRKALGFDIKVNCKANVRDTSVLIGSDGEPGKSCTSRRVPYNETVKECKDVCHVKDRLTGECLEPDQLCTTKVVQKFRTETSCVATEYTVNFDTTGNAPVNSKAMKSFIKLTKVTLKTGSDTDEKTEYRSKPLTIQTEAYLQLKCKTRDIGTPFADFKTVKKYSYKEMSAACEGGTPKLVSNRPLYFGVGVIEFTFDAF